MQKRWVRKNVDLVLLIEYVESFFKNKGFKTSKDGLTSGFTITAKPQERTSILEPVIIGVSGTSDDFLIEFSTSGRSRSTVRFGFVATMFGGGSLILRGLKSQEALEKLEKDFWIYVEEAIAHMINSTS